MRLAMVGGFLSLLLSVSPVQAQDALSADAVQMETIVVSGEQPGPGLWKVTKGDHVLWVLGTLSPLPKDMSWKSSEVEAVVATAQEVLKAPRVNVKADVGFFSKVTLLPSLIGIRNNPEREKLRDVLPPDLYERWSVLKKKYIGQSAKVEKWRPIFAALELYEAAIKSAGLSESKDVQKTVMAAAKRHGVKATSVDVVFTVEDPRAAIKELKNTSVDDLDCFRKTLDRIDSDLGTMTARANAWATADLDALRQLPYTDQMTACKAAVADTSLVRSRGITDVDARVEKAWVDAATTALERNAVTVALLPIRHLLAPDNYLGKLKALGSVVESPDEQGLGDPVQDSNISSGPTGTDAEAKTPDPSQQP